MAPIVQIEPNGNQALLMFDNARQDLEDNGWLTFVKRFEGFNLCVARQFPMTFDGYRAKVGDIQLEIDERFISLATGLLATGQRWFKNCKVEEVPWTLLFLSCKVTSCDRAMPISTLKPRWHDTLMIIKQFVTCEGRYGLVFLYHLRLLMIFMGYSLNMPFYFHHSMYKMSKRFKRHQDDKAKPPAESKPIVLSEDSDSEVERFLASEYPYSQGLCLEPPFDFMTNLPPYLKNDPRYLGIKLPHETLDHLAKPSPALSIPTQSPCDQCDSWLERYYIDVPILQSRIQSLEDQIAVLTSQRAKLQAADKKQKTTGSILFKNIESATAVVNSKLA
jgi:hypothetical protein